jgi:hypothetical protein
VAHVRLRVGVLRTDRVPSGGATTTDRANLLASAVAGVLWTTISPAAAFIYALAFVLIALIAFANRGAGVVLEK